MKQPEDPSRNRIFGDIASMTDKTIRECVITEHARAGMKRRGLDEALIREVLGKCEQSQEMSEGRRIVQSRMILGEPAKMYLVRVFVDDDRHPPEVVTVYKTSKISKYWKE